MPERRNGELIDKFFVPDTGETVHKLGGGGVSHKLLDVDLRRPPGGVPITNCTDGGDNELISMSFCIGFSDRFILIGCERGIFFIGDEDSTGTVSSFLS